MAEEPQPPTIVEGASTPGDGEDEVAPAAKSAEDRKAAEALAKLDTPRDDDDGGGAAAKDVDQEAVNQAMKKPGRRQEGPS